MDIEFTQDSIAQVARKLKAKLSAGDVVGFSGQLAAGKTTLTSEIVKQFGYTGKVSSPTFVIEHRYPVNNVKKIKEIIHLDLYRLKKDELNDLDWDEYKKQKNTLVIIEWPERLPAGLIELNKLIKLKIINDKKRHLTLLDSSDS